MRLIKSIIVDDEKRACNVLVKIISDYLAGDVAITGVAHNTNDAIEIINTEQPDLVFLDIEMAQGDGFTLLKRLPEINFKVIFITAHSQYAIKAIKFSALDYLLKPISIDELIAAVVKCKKILLKESKTAKAPTLKSTTNAEKLYRIALPGLHEVQFVEIEDIIHLEADSNYTTFYLENNQKIVVSHTLKEYEEILASLPFLRVHNSYIVNLKKVKKYIKGKGGYAVMNNGATVEISPKKKDVFLSAFDTL
ncbi:MAG TPA: LytTR family DNA-binding domain-containing protein [Bacteroidia bacterium]|nr:LytTR family DNA-binding domain-containing protein [Bacteroidia bacterium]